MGLTRVAILALFLLLPFGLSSAKGKTKKGKSCPLVLGLFFILKKSVRFYRVCASGPSLFFFLFKIFEIFQHFFFLINFKFISFPKTTNKQNLLHLITLAQLCLSLIDFQWNEHFNCFHYMPQLTRELSILALTTTLSFSRLQRKHLKCPQRFS